MSDFVGIDLGNSRIKVAVLDASGNPAMLPNADGDLCTPSCVYFGPDGPVYGKEARNMGLADPSRFVENWKRHMGTRTVLYKDDQGTEYCAKGIAKLLLGKVRDDFEVRTGQVLSRAAISVPANYTDVQKQETKDAAEEIGITVVCMPHEPTAALFGNRVEKRGDGTRLVTDLGGSTFDVSIGEVSGNRVATIATDGDAALGGQDWNDRIMDLRLDDFEAERGYRLTAEQHPLPWQELVQRTEDAKVALSTRDKTALTVSCNGDVHNSEITRTRFEERSTDLVQRVIDCIDRTLAESSVRIEDIKEILPVGGPSQMPMIAEAIERKYGRKPTVHCEPHFAVALGCVVAGRLAVESEGGTFSVGDVTLPPLNLSAREVTRWPIGVAVLDEKHRMINCEILPKATPIPSDQTRAFRLAEAGQTDAKIMILQGVEGALQEKCLQLGHFEMTDMTPVHDQIHKIEIRCHLDRNGILSASGYDPLSGRSADMTIDYKKGK